MLLSQLTNQIFVINILTKIKIWKQYTQDCLLQLTFLHIVLDNLMDFSLPHEIVFCRDQLFMLKASHTIIT